MRGAGHWWRWPIWLAELFTGAKSFVDNPILGSPRLNRAGLHLWRLKAAHAVARWRRSRLAQLVPAELRARFDRDGFVVVPNPLDPERFAELRSQLFECSFDCRVHQQGDTITRRVAFGPAERRCFPMLAQLIDSHWWRGLMAYVASSRTRPLYYLQSISGGCAEGPPDPQVELHSDTFHPSLKAFYFLTDVGEADRPLTYVQGSHRLTPARREWEQRRSITVRDEGDRLSQRGSLRIAPDELAALGLPQPTHFTVSANTLVVIDTCGFHARADGSEPSLRVELWGYSRRNPFLPWLGGGLFAWGWIGDRRAGWLHRLIDRLDEHGLYQQQWAAGGKRRLLEP